MIYREKTHELLETYGRKSFVMLLLVLLARLVAMYCIPLNDSTEARYAEIARLMLTSHNWVSLMHYPGQYFWAKPPLSTWLSAISMQTLGVSAFSARLPAWILSLLCMGLVGFMAAMRYGLRGAYWAMAILATTLYFLLDAGTVMTDPALMTCVVLVMVGFWKAIHSENSFWKWVPFIGWGLGLLAKGLVMGVFSVLPLMAWLVITKQYQRVWQALPWVKGSLLTLVIALPWFVLAEIRTPGFLNYFLIGEHFMRFLKPGWTGDMYGFAHEAPIGMIWVYFIVGTLPWSFILLIWTKTQKGLWAVHRNDIAWTTYLLCFILMPLLFFTFARNIIYPYVFPVLPAFALFFTSCLLQTGADKTFTRLFNMVAMIFVFVLMAAGFIFSKFPIEFSKSNNTMIAVWKNNQQSPQEHLIYLMNRPEYSSMFYSNGKALATRSLHELCTYLKQGPQFLVSVTDEPIALAKVLEQEFKPIYIQKHRQRLDVLYRVDRLPSFCIG